MSENEKDNRDFEFIKEQVIVKKNKKFKKWFIPICMTILMAILFGLIAAATFCLTEPRLYKFLHKEEANKTPITFPTEYPDDPNNEDDEMDSEASQEEDEDDNDSNSQVDDNQVVKETETVIIENTIADLDDYLNMYDEIKTIVYEANKSLVKVTSIVNEKDWYGNPIELKIETTGVVIANNNADLLILVSLDRVKDANSIVIKLSDKEVVEAELQDYESDLNLAIIAVPLEDIPVIYKNNITVATLGESYMIAVGNPVIALGSPNGHPNSMEVGIITSRGSAISVTDNRLDLFNTDIKNTKHSDGIIINMNGEIIGLITRTLKEDVNEELSTAIGISKLKSIIERMANQEPRIYCGVKTEDMTEEARTEHNVDNGIYVNEVKTNSPAFDAGIKKGDIILQINNAMVLNSNNFYNIISSYQPEDEIMVKVKRTSSTSEKELELELILLEKEGK